MKHVAAWLLFFLVLFWLWFLLAGEWTRTEVVAATAAAATCATLGEIARSRAGASAVVPLGVARSIPGAVAMVFVDFALVVAALFRRAEGTFVERTTDVAGSQQERAWATYLATLSPNAYVVDIDGDTKVALTHHLVLYERSQEPV